VAAEDRLHFGLAGAGLASTLAAVAAALSTIRVSPAGGHDLDVAGRHFSYPAVNAAAVLLILLALLGVAVIAVLIREARRELAGQRAYLRRLRPTGSLPGHADVTVIDERVPLAFCAGFVRPRVYVSTGTLAALAAPELDMVVTHERHHRARRDPLRLACARILSHALFFLPVLRPLQRRSGALSELRADAAAVRAAGGDAGPLASAMLAVAGSDSGEVVGIAPERVDGLLGRSPALQVPALLLALALATVAALAGLVWRMSAIASVKTSLAPPLVSSKPCVLVLALVPVAVALAGLLVRR
jgi:Zn-dependent protease with chaperone function